MVVDLLSAYPPEAPIEGGGVDHVPTQAELEAILRTPSVPETDASAEGDAAFASSSGEVTSVIERPLVVAGLGYSALK